MLIPNTNLVEAAGVANNATNLFGNGNFVFVDAGTGLTSPGLSSAFDVFGNGNNVEATKGPFAVAGTIGVNGKTVIQNGTGFNVYSPLNP
ncbi:MAG: hypothetical protein JO106_07030 [Mycobacterium sp.]|nr:hypothetical protein [Mycobacterium sp.]